MVSIGGQAPHFWSVRCSVAGLYPLLRKLLRPIPRHRVFATNFGASVLEHPNCRGLAKRSSEELGWEYRDMSVTGKGRRAGTSERWSYLLGIHWPVSQHGLAEAIPPAYSQFIGSQLITHVQEVAA